MCLERTLAEQKNRLAAQEAALAEKTNSLGDSKNSLLKCNQQINIMASESHHINSDGIYL